MKRCQVKTGFFVLKECGDVAVARCNNCKKHICIEHSKDYIKPITEANKATEIPEADSKVFCLECYTQINKESLAKTYAGGYQSSTSSDLLWYFYMRDSFYSSYNYRPFDNYDSDSFNTVSSGGDFDDNEGSSSFYDS